MHSLKSLILVLVLGLTSASVDAGESKARISGKVSQWTSGDLGAHPPIPGIVVELYRQESVELREGAKPLAPSELVGTRFTDRYGWYSFENLEPGIYAIQTYRPRSDADRTLTSEDRNLVLTESMTRLAHDVTFSFDRMFVVRIVRDNGDEVPEGVVVASELEFRTAIRKWFLHVGGYRFSAKGVPGCTVTPRMVYLEGAANSAPPQEIILRCK